MTFKIVGIGEVLWDLLPSGAQIGGAPANFAYHAGALGAHASVITRVGPDKLGYDIRQDLARMGLPADLMQVDESAPTGTVTVDVDGDGIPRFVIRENVAWDYLRPSQAALKAVATADAVCFGTLAQRGEPSRSTIRALLRQAPSSSLRVLDINLRQNFYSREVVEQSLGLANVLKLNDAELPMLAAMFNLSGDTREQIGSLANRFELSLVGLTRGPQGSLLYESGRWSECRAHPIRVKDTVGAGDAFTAALVMGLLQKLDLDRINVAANEVAQFVCSCSGATPPLPDELCALFLQASHSMPVAGPNLAASNPVTVSAK